MCILQIKLFYLFKNFGFEIVSCIHIYKTGLGLGRKLRVHLSTVFLLCFLPSQKGFALQGKNLLL